MPAPRLGKLEEAIGSLPLQTPLPGTEVSLSVLRALGEGLESEDTTFLEASGTLSSIMLSPSVLSLEPLGRGLTRGWEGLCRVHKHPSAIQWPRNKGALSRTP